MSQLTTHNPAEQEIKEQGKHPTNWSNGPPKMIVESYHDNRDRKPRAVKPIERQIKACIYLTPERDLQKKLIRKAIELQQEKEENHIPNIDIKEQRERLMQSDSIFLREEISANLDKIETQLKEINELMNRRDYWYHNEKPTGIKFVLKEIDEWNSNIVSGTLSYKTKTIIPNNQEKLEDHHIHERELAPKCISPTEYGYELPLTVLSCISKNEGRKKIYPFVPHMGILTCTGPRKTKMGQPAICKHEMAAIQQQANGELSIEGPEIPQRWTRLVHKNDIKYVKNKVLPEI